MRLQTNGRFKGLHKFTTSVIATAIFATTPVFAKTSHSGPLLVDDAYVLANGNIITGDFLGTATTPAITITTQKPIIVLNTTVQGEGDMIVGTGSNDITVLNTNGIGLNPNARGKQKGIFLRTANPINVSMRNCVVQGARIGLYVNGFSGLLSHNQSIRVISNNFLNMDARPSDGKGSFETTGQYNGQAVHIGNTGEVSAMEIGWNQVTNVAGESSTGSLIEISESGGTDNDHALVHDNYVQGCFPTFPGKDLYQFGGIIIDGMTTDTLNNTASFIDIYNNQVVATANTGIAVTAGHDITISNNRVVSAGFLPDGTFYAMKPTYGFAFGLYNANRYNLPATVFFNNNVIGNTSGLIRNDGAGQPIRSDWSLPGQKNEPEGNINFQPNTNTRPDLSDEAQELLTWQNKLKLHGVAVGLHK